MDDETLILIAYIKNAPNREKVLKSFEGEDFLRPIQISKKLNLHPNAVSKKLKDLREHELVYVINPEYNVPRLYRVTDKGKRIIDFMNNKHFNHLGHLHNPHHHNHNHL